MLIRFAVSRQREYLADAGAVELTRYPPGMIGALEKLGASTRPLKAANQGTSHLYIVNPLRNARITDSWLNRLRAEGRWPVR